MTDPTLLAMLRCPATGQPLGDAPAAWVDAINRAVGEGRLYDVGQRRVDAPVEGALIVADESLLYPVRAQIPTLIPDWGIRCSDLAVDAGPAAGG